MDAVLTLFIVGITPVGAGKRRTTSQSAIRPRDHPRGCGEKTADNIISYMEGGSLPRVRGKGTGFSTGIHTHGITPAGAGKSASYSHTVGYGQDHPRGCGEKSAGF